MKTIILQSCYCTLLLLLCNIGISFGSSCSECFDPYTSTTESQRNCSLLQNVLTCHSNAQDCQTWIITYVWMIQAEMERKNCSIATMAPAPTTTPTPPPSTPQPVSTTPTSIPEQVSSTMPPSTLSTPPPPLCPTVSTQLPSAFEEANIQRAEGISEQCMRTSRTSVQCSMFMNSHLRPFRFLDQADNIQTCSVSGTWELFSHEDLVIQVEGRREQEVSQHTRLTKVNVTFSPREGCNEETKSYIAYNDRSLPSEFEDASGFEFEAGSGVDVATTSALQLQLSEGGDVVTLIANWLDAFIIIRNMGGYLAVTFNVTGPMAFESQGLCTARCPDSYLVDSMSYLLRMRDSCPSTRNSAFFSCIVALNQEFVEVTELSYTEICMYSLLREESPYQIIMSQALVADAHLLPPHGNVPIPPSIIPPRPLSQTTPPPATSTPPATATPPPPVTSTPPPATYADTSTTHSTNTPASQTSSASLTSSVIFEIVSHATAPSSSHVTVVMATSLYLLYNLV